MKSDMRETVASVPLLGSLPFVGAFFRHNKQVAQKSELVILLRPVVVENGNQWAQARNEAKGHFNDLNRGFHYGGKMEVFGDFFHARGIPVIFNKLRDKIQNFFLALCQFHDFTFFTLTFLVIQR